jgi:putative restriction endonuclease
MRVDLAYEHSVRAAAMVFVRSLAAAGGGTVTRGQLQQFAYLGEPIKLLDTGRGIRNPRQLVATLTILTSAGSRYDDTPGPEGLLRYAIRDGELGQGDNRKLRAAFELALPIIWFHGVRDGVFVPLMPVFLAAEEAATKRYVVALDEDQLLMAPQLLTSSPIEGALGQALAQRRYVERMSRQRLHQPVFRAGVLLAYRTRCAVCSLTHGGLLDAAHITEDAADGGDPVTSNGLALCKIHHAAYDQDILGISPERVVHINRDVLEERDGPMLQHGLQEFHGTALRVIPERRAEQPDPDRLAQRFARFRNAS